MSHGGQVYNRGAANYEVRRHVHKTVTKISPGKCKIIPFLTLNDSGTKDPGSTVRGSSKVTSQGTKVYSNCSIEPGSYVKWHHLDVIIRTEDDTDSEVLDFYIGRGAFSFHDIKSNTVYGLNYNSGRVRYSDEGSTPSYTTVVATGGANQAVKETSLTYDVYNLGDVVKHWWGQARRNVIYGGQPILFNRWQKIPAKCRRGNDGMFYGMIIMNDATPVSGDKDVLNIEVKNSFTETPLIQ